MKLLARAVPRWRKLVRPATWYTLSVLLVGGAVEAMGRQTSTDLHDALSAAIVGLLALMVGLRHRREPLPWVERLAAVATRLGGWLRRFTFEIGIDLRGDPPVPRGLPPVLTAVIAGLVGWGALALAAGPYLPQGFRAVAVPVFYLGYLAALIVLWALLAAGVLLAMFVPFALIHDAFVAAHAGPGRRPRRGEFLVLSLYFAGLGLVGYHLPAAVPLAVAGVALAVTLVSVLLPHAASVQFLWRPRGGGAVRAIPWGAWVLGEFGLIALALAALVLTADGGWGPDRSSPARQAMPITTFLGGVLAALSPGLLCLLALQAVLGRLRDPARPARPVLHLAGVTAAERLGLRRWLARRGWDSRLAPGPARPGDVRAELVAPARSEATEFEPRWPLRVSRHDLEEGGVFERLSRRDELQHRRRALGALEGLFKRAAGRKFRNGSGFWVAPQFWFVTGLTRDVPEEDVDLTEGSILSGTIGPPYHRVLSRATRHYLYELLRAVQVDLIFVEDGIGFRRLKQVVRVLFDVYDRHAGQRRAEETHFRGLPKTRVLIHEFQLDEPFQSTVYPEPKYEHLGRARILHVFRDRGEHEEPVEPPVDWSQTPAPVGMSG
jgi:hypothetical protein